PRRAGAGEPAAVSPGSAPITGAPPKAYAPYPWISGHLAVFQAPVACPWETDGAIHVPSASDDELWHGPGWAEIGSAPRLPVVPPSALTRRSTAGRKGVSRR